MPSMISREDIKRLLSLQAQDKILDDLRTRLAQIPLDIDAVRRALDHEKSLMTEAKTKSTRLALAKKEKELELGQKEEAIRKHSGELNQVKSNDAYKALLSEIDKFKAAVGDLETSILMLMEEIDQASREEKAEALKVKEVEAKAQEQIRAHETKKAELEAAAQQENAKRTGLLEGIPADLLKLYDYLRQRKQGVALAPVQGTICGICKITLLPQSVVELNKGNKLVACESCQRILYIADALQPA